MSHPEDYKLIEEIAAHPAVFDMKHVFCKDQHAKDNIWVVIAGEVGKTGTTKQRADRNENYEL